ncbi:unnamed protein product [Rhizophagus irregularis]|uniref:Protein kinase domain-containing protein n=1 Tax=Rhizophagus irregularis TaxID=588596 RepID=A0A915ZNR7_9GLOM|nr:unnamed protein product [Rhizophagus irregularis]
MTSSGCRNCKNSNELNESNDDFVKELKLLREIEDHPKINRFLGITKDSDYYILVLEYANEGNLRDYLKKKFTYLRWNDKIQMALDITGGLKFIHSKEIIHRDLHSKNILVNNGKLLIADFGLSKKLAEITTNSVGNRQGMIEYIEPQCFKNKNDIDDFYITSDRLNLNSRNNQNSRQNEKHQKNYEENNIRIVVGLEFGLTYSGFSYCHMNVQQIYNLLQNLKPLRHIAWKILKDRILRRQELILW